VNGNKAELEGEKEVMKVKAKKKIRDQKPS
jgi:hypothetical protein